MWGASLCSTSRVARGARSFSSPRVMTASKVALQQLPLVDQQILDDMRSACIKTGFFTVPTEGVLSSQLIKAAYSRADEFIALPDEVKQQYHCKRSPNARGWTPMFEEPSYQPDVVSHLEGFDLARELPETYVKEGSSLGPNVWPVEVPRFREDVYALYIETTKLSTVLFKSFADMLGLPMNTFLQHVDEEAEAFMRLLTYPETDARTKNSTVGIASHTDFECFTIIHQNGEGLHLMNRKGYWVEAPVCDDRLFVMVGDILEHWTNGVLAATEHRVCNSEKKRQSIVRFNGANGDTVVEPLPAFVTPENPPRYARMTQREHITHQIELAEQLLQKTKSAAHA
ncbi:2OG-Fe(II) oxygenase superfamily protein [Phytophthora infestans T30-4]|uniref:2OG-Fe(II) oxygenase superfamily protein n=2 Tax=Phytophthora infestans TaxID=4787 RepID=D0MQA6_PHYIT|nr:2OG-Fe(II) oxygenase superfamily protein [Phytophthora infestans T30-4]EEY57675.1 2OG-Fe(II) oxygenase superfamily protein [Phytophthora infestans T30-4]|eukprot:XP_002908861.1 2OG-Fe(II) oxygenase superfamily protein [Phytophthora infestans T30-4]